jgi:hypothetical protein
MMLGVSRSRVRPYNIHRFALSEAVTIQESPLLCVSGNSFPIITHANFTDLNE